jgi:hypothetical protein
MLWFLAAASAHPPTLSVSYTVAFDLDEMGDKLCALTKLCDCTSTYTGTGKLVTKEGDRATYEGTWTRTANTCADALLIWTPPDGKAFHTIRTADGKATEWIVHGDATNHTKRTADIKASGQFWIDALEQPWPAERATIRQQDGTTLAAGIQLSTQHTLELSGGR